MAETKKTITLASGKAKATTSTVLDDGMPGVPCPDSPGYVYTGMRYVPIFNDPAEWASTNTYEPLTIVIHEGNSYTSKTFVPVGIDIANSQYWVLTGNYNYQVELYRQEVASIKVRLSVENQEALKNANLTNGYVLCMGASSLNDGGEGLFFISDSESINSYTVKMNNGSYAAYIAIDGIANLKTMGATTQSDSSTYITNALNYTDYKKFFLPSGVYPVSNTIVVKRDYISILGATKPAPTASATAVPSGSVLQWTGIESPDTAIMLVSPKQSYEVDQNFPIRGFEITNVSFDGKLKAGFGLYIPFMAYSGYLDGLYSQGCLSSGLLIASAWMVKIGELNTWYNGIGVVLGFDRLGKKYSINQVSIEYLNGHNSTVMNGTSGLSVYRGTGVVITNTGSSIVNILDAEYNSTQGAFLEGTNGLVVNSAWFEMNKTGTATNGLACTVSKTSFQSIVLSGKDLIKATNTIKIGMIDSDTAYNPFEGSVNVSVSLGLCGYNLRNGQDLTTWKALIVEYKEWGRFNNLHTNAVVYGNYFNYPSEGINNSLVIIPHETKECDTFVIAYGGKTLTIPALNWVAGKPLILPAYASSTNYNTFLQVFNSAVSTADLKHDIAFCSIRYFNDGNWQQLTRNDTAYKVR